MFLLKTAAAGRLAMCFTLVCTLAAAPPAGAMPTPPPVHIMSVNSLSGRPTCSSITMTVTAAVGTSGSRPLTITKFVQDGSACNATVFLAAGSYTIVTTGLKSLSDSAVRGPHPTVKFSKSSKITLGSAARTITISV